MACNLLSRLFRRRDRQLPVSADRPSPPALPAHSDKFQLEHTLKQLHSNDLEYTELYFLGCLSEQGSYTLTVPDIPFGTDNINIQSLRDLPGFIALEAGTPESPFAGVDVQVHFSTAAEAALAMASQPTISLGSGSSRQLQYEEGYGDVWERATKRQKTQPSEPRPKCLMCCEEIEGAHARPCLFCGVSWCYDCLRSNFLIALEDQERFPVRCCGRIVHFDVGKGILATADYTRYKTRFEEHCTTKPVYCAHPPCSEFLPTRISKPDENGRVLCSSCQNITCVDCRVLVDPSNTDTHLCTAADEMTALISQFEYKRCPRCNTGVAKMWGCPHVRCQCGAHWCWDCERAIHICWRKPCARAREEGEMTDYDDEPEEESNSEDESISENTIIDPVQQVPQAEAMTTEIVSLETAQATEGNNTSVQGDSEPPASGDDQGEGVRTDPVSLESALNDETVEIIGSSNLRAGEGHSPEHEDTADVLGNLHTLTAEDLAVIAQWPLPLSNSDVPAATVAADDINDTDDTTTPPVRPAPLEYRPPAALMVAPTVPTPQGPPATGDPFVNLDGYDQDDWETSSLNFGDEPMDETWDTWGCLHHFNSIPNERMHEYWLPEIKAVEPQLSQPHKHIDCLKCYKTITIIITKPASEDKKTNTRKDSGIGTSTPPNVDLGDMPHTAQVTPTLLVVTEKKTKKLKTKKQGERPKIFNCVSCGVIYCTACKGTTTKELNAVLDRVTTPR